ncbi:hypothetical protein LINPERHAP1_LOCUS17523 [Linum perenne]
MLVSSWPVERPGQGLTAK